MERDWLIGRKCKEIQPTEETVGGYGILAIPTKYAWQSVGGYGILAIPTKSAWQSWQSGYGRDAISSYI